MFHKSVLKYKTLEFFGASRQKILAPAGGWGVWAFGPHTPAARDQTAAMRARKHVEKISSGPSAH